MATDDLVLMAEIGAAHGIRGEVRVKPYGDDPMALADYGPLLAEDGREFVIRALRPQKHMLIVRFEGVDDRNQAEALTRTRLFVPRDRLPAPDEDDFYHADLIGLRVLDESGRMLGHVVTVPNFGAGDLLEVRPELGQTFYLPFTRAVVPDIDVAGGCLHVRVPPGLFGGDGPSEDASGDEGDATGPQSA